MEQEKLSKIMMNADRNIDSIIEYCAFCQKETRYKRCDPIETRECYVDGGGQLCDECYMEIYEKSAPHDIMLLKKK